MVYAVPVGSTIATGNIRSIDTSAAEKMPGVLPILHHNNFDGIYRNGPGGRNSENRPPLSDNTVSYWGQYVALAVADTFAQANAGAAAVRVQYDAAKANVATDLSDPLPAIGAPGGPHIQSQRGDSDAAFASAPVKIDAVYRTPVETHNPMEMHATIAVWHGPRVTLYESTQGVVNHHNVMARSSASRLRTSRSSPASSAPASAASSSLGRTRLSAPSPRVRPIAPSSSSSLAR